MKSAEPAGFRAGIGSEEDPFKVEIRGNRIGKVELDRGIGKDHRRGTRRKPGTGPQDRPGAPLAPLDAPYHPRRRQRGFHCLRLKKIKCDRIASAMASYQDELAKLLRVIRWIVIAVVVLFFGFMFLELGSIFLGRP